MVVGSNPKGDDMAVNVCKTKHLTNTRASGLSLIHICGRLMRMDWADGPLPIMMSSA